MLSIFGRTVWIVASLDFYNKQHQITTNKPLIASHHITMWCIRMLAGIYIWNTWWSWFFIFPEHVCFYINIENEPVLKNSIHNLCLISKLFYSYQELHKMVFTRHHWNYIYIYNIGIILAYGIKFSNNLF